MDVPERRPGNDRLQGWSWLWQQRGYVIGAASSAGAAAASLLAAPHASLAHVMVLYLLGPVLISTRYSASVSIFTILVSTLCFDYFNIPPQFAFAVPGVHDLVTLGGMLVTAVTVCFLIQRLRYQRSMARSSEARTLSLCALSLDLSQVTQIEALPAAAEQHLARLFGVPSRVLLEHGTPSALDDAGLPSEERTLALAAFAERVTCFLPARAARIAFQPFGSGSKALGVIRVPLASRGCMQAEEQTMLLAACADRVATAVERLSLAATARQAQIETEAERLRNELLSAISHDLKTPLASILTAGSTLLAPRNISEPQRRMLLHTIVEETERLNTLVTNLLSVTRLESGNVTLNESPEALDELIFGTLSRLSNRLDGRDVNVHIPRDLPLVPMDPVLVDQVLVNLIENVLRHTPEASPIDIAVETSSTEVRLEVADRGPGVAPQERAKVFEKFYRGSRAKPKDGGSGLGLTICRAVARAHGGRIALRSRDGGGIAVELALPIRPGMVHS